MVSKTQCSLVKKKKLVIDINYSILTSGNVHCRYIQLFLHYRYYKGHVSISKFQFWVVNIKIIDMLAWMYFLEFNFTLPKTQL